MKKLFLISFFTLIFFGLNKIKSENFNLCGIIEPICYTRERCDFFHDGLQQFGTVTEKEIKKYFPCRD